MPKRRRGNTLEKWEVSMAKVMLEIIDSSGKSERK